MRQRGSFLFRNTRTPVAYAMGVTLPNTRTNAALGRNPTSAGRWRITSLIPNVIASRWSSAISQSSHPKTASRGRALSRSAAETTIVPHGRTMQNTRSEFASSASAKQASAAAGSLQPSLSQEEAWSSLQPCADRSALQLMSSSFLGVAMAWEDCAPMGREQRHVNLGSSGSYFCGAAREFTNPPPTRGRAETATGRIH